MSKEIQVKHFKEINEYKDGYYSRNSICSECLHHKGMHYYHSKDNAVICVCGSICWINGKRTGKKE